MPKNLKAERKYVLACLIGKSTGIFHWIRFKYWTWRVNQMSEGELMDTYYSLIGD